MSLQIGINQHIFEMEYAVRGPIPQRAAELAKQGMKCIPCNIGNPQALGQRPITYYRQVLSLIEEPSRIERERKLNRLAQGVGGFGRDLISDYVLDQCESLLSKMPTGMGAYTESKGPLFIREAIASYIDKRDDVGSAGVGANPDNIFLTNGASEGARYLLEMLLADPKDGVMIPTPQYPLYSATIKKCGGTQVNYYPDEDNDWNLSVSALEESIAKARKDGINVKAIVVINPGNPTGAILDEQSIKDVIDFAERHGLIVMADEVYQENLYGAEFFSFAKVLGDRDVPLFSFHSTSKGFYGECGHRGGYLESRNAPMIKDTQISFLDILLKQASVSLCSNTAGQLLTYLMVSPPEEGSEPYVKFVQEKQKTLSDLYDKATIIKDALTHMEGVKCFGRIGAMYLFPRLEKLPEGTTDFDYCMALLEKTGLVTVNGSGFGQRAGTSHLRIAFLPPKVVLEDVLPKWTKFHNDYVNQS